MPFAGPYTEAKMFDEDEIWSLLKDNEKKFREGLYERLFSERARQNLTMVYKVQVTPSRIILTGPEPEAKNRILRKYPRHTDYFTRVQFCDEDGQDLYYSPKCKSIPFRTHRAPLCRIFVTSQLPSRRYGALCDQPFRLALIPWQRYDTLAV